jgi:MFS family permease
MSVPSWAALSRHRRAAQGLGGGMLIALSYGMASELYPAELRPRVFSLISGVWGTADRLGPTVGGVFAALGWWRGAFWVAASVIIGLMSLAWYSIPATAGLIANAAGLAQGVSMVTVASAAMWVDGLGTLVPVVLTVLALRLLWLQRQSSTVCVGHVVWTQVDPLASQCFDDLHHPVKRAIDIR